VDVRRELGRLLEAGRIDTEELAVRSTAGRESTVVLYRLTSRLPAA
jgi:hypothetical protein